MELELINKFESIVGKENVNIDPAEIYCYSRDSTPFQYFADVVIRPYTNYHVSHILKVANKNSVAVYPRGSGTSISGSPLPVNGGIVLDLTQMNKILEFDENNLQVLVEPGVICDNLNSFLEEHGYFFPPDPSSSSVATIGGMVANNSGGNRAIKYGTTKDWVLWMECVLANGEIVNTGSNCLKSVSGYDITKLLCGSEGTLAIFTKIRLRIHPLPEDHKTAIFFFDDIDKVGQAILNVKSSGIVPVSLEFLDRLAIDVSKEYAQLELPFCEALIIVETDGLKEAVEKELEILIDMIIQAGPIQWKKAESEEERFSYWIIRKSAFPALARTAVTIETEDISVPVSKIPEALSKISHIQKILRNQVRICTFGHAGDGNLHPTFLYDERIPEQKEAFFSGLKMLSSVALELGGSITGEHGVGLVRKDFIEKEHGRIMVKLMQNIKIIFDPNNILNPGKGKPWGSEPDRWEEHVSISGTLKI